jgi:hypothetical protein
LTFSSAGSVRQQRFKPRPVRVKSTEHINQRADDPLETFRHGRMSGRFEAVPDDTVFRGRLPARVMAAKKIGQVNPQLLRQEVGTGLGCPRGVIGSLAVRSGAAQSDNYVLHAPARADPRFLVVLLVPGIHDLPTEPTAQVVLRGIHGSIVRLPRTRVASSRRPEAPRHRLAGVPSHHPSERDAPGALFGKVGDVDDLHPGRRAFSEPKRAERRPVCRTICRSRTTASPSRVDTDVAPAQQGARTA